MANQTVQSCAKCKKNINSRSGKPLLCDGKCRQWFHKTCTTLSDAEYQEIQTVPDKFWFCVPCKENRNRCRRSTLNMAEQPLSTIQPVAGAAAVSSGLEVIIARIESKLDQLIGWQQDVISEVRDIHNTLGELRTTTETLMDEQQQLRDDNHELRKQLEWCEIEIDRQKQDKLKKSFEISNVPVAEDEDLMKIAAGVCQAIGVSLESNDVKEIFRTPNNLSLKSQFPPSICVKLYNKKKREEVMAKKKGKKELTTASLNMATGNANVNMYINEVLTKRNRYLFKKARDLKRDGKIKFAWFRDGRLLVRKTEKSKVREISSIQALNEFTK